jgi:hypothetical protein
MPAQYQPNKSEPATVADKVKKREHQPKLHIDGERIEKERFTQCNMMLQYSTMNLGRILFFNYCGEKD